MLLSRLKLHHQGLGLGLLLLVLMLPLPLLVAAMYVLRA
jgi:hypothetical protein